MAYSPFDRVPWELIEDIVFFALTLGPFGPPTDYLPLRLVSRQFASALSERNSQLYARIFEARFDAEAYYRRVGSEARVADNASRELKRRWVVLARFRDLEHCFSPAMGSLSSDTLMNPRAIMNGVHISASGDSKAAGETLLEMLWTALLMMVENGGLNERLLRECAQVNRWLDNFWFHRNGASYSVRAIEKQLWPPHSESAALAMWILWMLLVPDHYIHDEPKLSSSLAVLRTVALGTHKYPIAQPDTERFDLPTCPPHRQFTPKSYGLYPLLGAPSIAAPAILAYYSLSLFKASDQIVLPRVPSTIREISSEEVGVVDLKSLRIENKKEGVEQEGMGDRDEKERVGGEVLDSVTFGKGKGKEVVRGEVSGMGAFCGLENSTLPDWSLEWESEWERFKSLGRYGPRTIGFGPVNASELGRRGHIPEGMAGGTSSGPGGGQESGMGRWLEGFKLGCFDGLWEGTFTASSSSEFLHELSLLRLPPIHLWLLLCQTGPETLMWHLNFQYTDFETFSKMNDGGIPGILRRAPFGLHSQTWSLREYHLLRPEKEGDGGRSLSVGSSAMAYFELGVVLTENVGKDALEVREPGRPGALIYNRYHRSSPSVSSVAPEHSDSAHVDKPNAHSPSTQPSYRRRVLEILVVGEGHSAWGRFKLQGRIRPYDSLVCLVKEYLDNGGGKWGYRGHLIGDEYGNLTGTWRDTVSPAEVLGYEGAFFLKRKF